jgi:uncharacterized membrane protein
MNDMIFFTIILISGFIPIIFIPYWTRKTESFGVSIPKEIYNSQQLKEMRKHYVLITSVFSLIILFFFWLLQTSFQYDENILAIFFSIIIGLYIVGTFLIYLVFHRKMKIIKIESDWVHQKSQLVVIDTSFRDQKLTYSNLWFMISFTIAIITIFFTFRVYDQIPDRIPMNYNLSGEVTNWVDKSYRSLLMMPIIQICMTFIFLFVNVVIEKAKQQISAENPEESIKQNIIFRRRWSAFIIWSGTALVLLFSIAQYSFIYPMNQQLLLIVSLALPIGVIVWAIILSITTGQGGSRISLDTDKTGKVIDRDDDQYWKLGQFYFNKNDPSIFLEKRFGVGWTNNWAHPISWIIILGIILLAVGIPLLLTI